mmetsp:Transcript_101692/g.294290  ORF Transcript_101692/g.294290 Transcript_101692/m.294290 type:complete len:487 (-) Transcript_101692:57-1517(-)
MCNRLVGMRAGIAGVLAWSWSAKAVSALAEAACTETDCPAELNDQTSILQLKVAIDLSKPYNWLGTRPQNGLRTVSASSYERCDLAASDCSLKRLNGKPTLVFPGGDTLCISGEAYAFAVHPGATDELAFYFEGGGACWVAHGQFVAQCTPDMHGAIRDSGLGVGILNRSSTSNPFRSWTIVEPLYCSGDAFVGHAEAMNGDNEVKFRGFTNAMAAKHWAMRNFKHTLKNFAIMGFSAGSLGTQSWAADLLNSFSFKAGAVLMDSYAGVFPGSTQGQILQDWGACTIQMLKPRLRAECLDGSLTVQHMLKFAMQQHPEVAFGSIQSKADESQIWFYKGIAASWGLYEDAGITDEQFYRLTSKVYQEYRSTGPNYVSYNIDGRQHCFLTSTNLFYTTSLAGKHAPAPERSPMLWEWVRDLLDHKSVSSECHGERMPVSSLTLKGCAANLTSLPLELGSARIRTPKIGHSHGSAPHGYERRPLFKHRR